MKPRFVILALLIAGFSLPVGAGVARGQAGSSPDDVEFFESRIRPVLVKHCYECHSAASAEAKGGLLLDFRDGLRTGGESGVAVIPGNPDDSLLLQALRFESFEMPPSGRLPESVIADFAEWIRRGAVDPRETPPTAAEVRDAAWESQLAERRHWWSLQPLKFFTPPTSVSGSQPSEPVDRFVQEKLHQAGLTSAPPADAQTLLRRLSFVLTGLPPRPEQVTSFPADYAADPTAALPQLVDSLLESPHFGERMARHWMDVVRYTDTYGYEWDNPARGSWEYRDYLIRAFNNDIGYDHLIREQLAGDLLGEPRMSDDVQVNESLIGPMFYHMGEHRHGSSLDFNGLHQDMIDNKIDAFSKAFLATTVACARCHDHKLDAVSQADYYALAGVFMSPRWTSRVIDAPGKHDTVIAALRKLRDEIHDRLIQHWLPADGGAPITAAAISDWAADNPEVLEAATLEDVTHPLAGIVAATDSTMSSVWAELTTQWVAERSQRLESNSTNYTLLTDFRQPGFPDGWTVEGDGIRHGYVTTGTPLISLSGDTLISELLPQGYHTHALSLKLPGAVRLPAQHELDGRCVSLQVRGGDWAGRLIIPQNAFQSESVKFLVSPSPAKWFTTADAELKNGVSHIRTEFMTASLNPNFPPRTGLARAGDVTLPNDDYGYDKRSWLSITGVVVHDTELPPADSLDSFQSLYVPDDQPPSTIAAAWQRVADWFNGSIHRWSENGAGKEDVKLMNWLIAHGLLANLATEAPEIAKLVDRYREAESLIEFPRTVNSMDERNVAPLDYRINVRGDVDNDGAAVPRGFLTVFPAARPVRESPHSGRLELADYLSSPENPQTARVYVNRVWQWVFGQGIVATSNDFGSLGDLPTHPELLDWLAARFMAEGWSTKTLIRRLVLSQTFRQSGQYSPAAMERDPDNRLLHHYSTRRLDAEAVRDSMLMVSAQLDPKLYGRPINPPRSVEDGAKRLYSGPLDGDGRRSLYLTMSIMDPPKFLVCFNLPNLKLSTGQRDETNVPAQAPAMLNDPLVTTLAESWAEHVVADGQPDIESKVRVMFIRGLGRSPEESEIRRWTDALISFSDSPDPLHDQQAWTALAHAFFNTKEFLYFR